MVATQLIFAYIYDLFNMNSSFSAETTPSTGADVAFSFLKRRRTSTHSIFSISLVQLSLYYKFNQHDEI